MTRSPSIPVVEVVDVTKRYGRGSGATVALDGVSLRVLRGEILVLMGPSGSGKSTLLNLIAGIDRADCGRVLIQGRDLRGLRDHELADLRLRSIGFVFQAFNLLPALTVWENVAWPLQFAGHGRGAVQQGVGRALDRVGLTGVDARHPAELSGGQQQRVAIARAIAGHPTLLVADEPTGNLDSHTGEMVLDLLRRLSTEDGTTIVMVTHDALAASYGSRILEMRDGRIVREAHALEPSGRAGSADRATT